MINVFLVDDHDLVRTGIRRILEDVRGLKVIGEATSGEQAVQWCRDNRADVIMMDMNMPGIGGLEATKKILRFNPAAKIIFLTVQTETPFPQKVMQAGASGYLTKYSAPDEMIQAIRAVSTGQRYISPEIAQQMALSQVSATQSENPFKTLSDREMQITMLITQGNKVPDIAEQLNLSPKTVNSYRYRLFEKLNINGDVELTRMAIRYGIVDAKLL